MNGIDRIYHLLVNQNADISRKYHRYRKKVHGAGRAKAWIYLIKLNIEYHFFGHLKNGQRYDENFPPKKLYMGGSESSLSVRESPEQLAEKLCGYDVISFDVFDTLIFRAFERPEDLFFMVGADLHYLDFKRIRLEIEQKAREKKFAKKQTREVTLDEIWNLMEKETGIPKDKGLQEEWENEKKYCFANPYMLEVLKKLREKGKKIIVLSDMYLGKERIEELLKKCGAGQFDAYFVSSDESRSKSDGTLYDFVKKKLDQTKTYIHIGDNEHSDVRQAKKHGFESIWYRNVNQTGETYRAEDMSVVTGSIYRGIVNAFLHNGRKEYPLVFEYGFIYGGLFAVGYCQWIHAYVKKNKIEKILFLSRDGDILSQVYERLYPEEHGKWEYVYWSRLAAAKMTARYFKYDYFRRFLFHKVNQNYSLDDIFDTMELGDLLEGFLRDSKEQSSYTKKSVLDENAAQHVKHYLEENWEFVISHYEEQTEAGRMYYADILKECKSAVAVDVGWAGSGASALDYLVNEVWKMKCPITGLVAGTNSAHNHEPDMSEAQLFTGKIVSYMFSQAHNRDIWKFHNPNRGDNMVIELLLASPERSFRKFADKESDFEFSASKDEIDSKQVQSGILRFTDELLEKIGKVPEISGRDAFAPIQILMENEEWLNKKIRPLDSQMNLE